MTISCRCLRPAAVAPFIVLGLLACGDLPRDPDGTLDRARNGTLTVGVTVAAPWVTATAGVSGAAGAPGADANAEPGGVEAELVASFAAAIGAEVEWVWGGAEENLARLERGELDIVAAGVTTGSPWKGRVALTRPHTEVDGSRHVLAAAPGENALLVALDRHIRRRK